MGGFGHVGFGGGDCSHAGHSNATDPPSDVTSLGAASSSSERRFNITTVASSAFGPAGGGAR
jgi:hypothetical protein